MNRTLRRDIRLVNTAGVLGTLYGLALGELLLFFVTQCLRIPKEDWALVASLLPLTTAFNLVSTWMTERLRRRKLISLTCFAVGRLAVPALTLLPFISGEHEIRFRLYYLAAALIAHGSIVTLGASAWLSWVTDIVPEERRGRFWAARLALTTLVYCGVYLAASWLVHHLGKANPWGYVWVFGFAFVVGEIDLLVHSFVADRPMPVHDEPPRLLPLLAAPWRHRGFRALMLYRTVFTFGGFVTVPFGSMYLIEELGLGPWQMGILTVTFLVVTGLSVFVWRVIGDRVGYRTVCLIADSLCGVSILYWWFLPHGNPAAAMAILLAARVHFGFLYAGINLAHSTLTMNIAPEKHRSTYFAQVTIIVALSMAAGIAVGRMIFLGIEPVYGTRFLAAKLTPVHVLIGLHGLSRLVGTRLTLRWVPDVKAEVAIPRIRRILLTNPRRVLSVLWPFERPLAVEHRERHVREMRDLLPKSRRDDLSDALRQVLHDEVHGEEEFYAFLGHERLDRGSGVRRITRELSDWLAEHHVATRAKGGPRRVASLFREGDLTRCLLAVRRLAHRTARHSTSPTRTSALSVIDAMADAADHAPPTENTVLLALYACLQVSRESRPAEGTGGTDAPHSLD
jgi:MFS family permease